MRTKAKILIVDDNRIIREVLRGLIRHDESFNVVGSASDGESALEMIGTLAPDLVCLDVLMPGPDGISIMRRIHAEYPGTRIVIISGESTPAVVQAARLGGASGFVVKPFNAEKVLRAIHGALRAPVPQVLPEPEPVEAEVAEAMAGGAETEKPAAAGKTADAVPEGEAAQATSEQAA